MTDEDNKKVVEITQAILRNLEELFETMGFDSTFVLMHIFNPPSNEEDVKEVWARCLAQMNERYFIKKGLALTFVRAEEFIMPVSKYIH